MIAAMAQPGDWRNLRGGPWLDVSLRWRFKTIRDAAASRNLNFQEPCLFFRKTNRRGSVTGGGSINRHQNLHVLKVFCFFSS
jgi:hypothetical protein